MTRLRLEITDRDDGEVETHVRQRLYEFNVAATGIDDGAMLVGSVRDAAGALVAGLYGWTWGGCAFVDLLWVDATRRGQGLGTRLLTGAEDEARARGCRQILLSTHGFQAPGFYTARGYRETGRDADYPVGSYQVHLAKPLA
ncbi:MAG: GNAT family N-acetyltransferase [Actinomycetes bacterium]